MRILILLFVSSLSLPCLAAEGGGPVLPPECWSESRMFHNSEVYPWKENVAIRAVKREKAKGGELSPNKGYSFVVEGGRPSGKVTIYTQKDHLTQISISGL